MPETPSITLYGKADCHLCDEAEVLVQAVAPEFGQSYLKVDIQSDPALFAAYRYRIPVVQVAGGASLDWPLTAGQLRRALQAVATP